MNKLEFLAYHHHGYSGGMTNWIAHTALSSVIHALIYGVVFKIMHRLTLGEAILLAAVVFGCLFLWARSQDRRGW